MVINRAMDTHSKSLCIITACIKCNEWAIALFDGPSTPENYLEFITDSTASDHHRSRPPFDWKKSGPILTKVSPITRNAIVVNAMDEEPNQCIFVRGYQIILSDDAWTRIRAPSNQ